MIGEEVKVIINVSICYTTSERARVKDVLRRRAEIEETIEKTIKKMLKKYEYIYITAEPVQVEDEYIRI